MIFQYIWSIKTCLHCSSTKYWQLSTSQIQRSHCSLTRRSKKNLWKKTSIYFYLKERLVEYFCLGVPDYRLHFQVPYSQPTIQKGLRILRETIYLKTIIELKRLFPERSRWMRPCLKVQIKGAKRCTIKICRTNTKREKKRKEVDQKEFGLFYRLSKLPAMQ